MKTPASAPQPYTEMLMKNRHETSGGDNPDQPRGGSEESGLPHPQSAMPGNPDYVKYAGEKEFGTGKGTDYD